MNPISEARLGEVYPGLAEKIRQMAEMLAQEDIPIVVTQGVRSWTSQDALYAQGRTAPGGIVTNCPGGYSWHNFGLACDVVPEDIAPGQPDWNVTHPAWQRVVAVGESLGLVSGTEWKTFKDWPHFQLTGRFSANPDDEVRQLFKDGGMQAVWDEAFKLEAT